MLPRRVQFTIRFFYPATLTFHRAWPITFAEKDIPRDCRKLGIGCSRFSSRSHLGEKAGDEIAGPVKRCVRPEQGTNVASRS